MESIGLYADDLVVHVRRPDPTKLRQTPFILIEIPRHKKQVILANQKGEITFVADDRFELPMWERLNKYQLKTLEGVTPVVLRDREKWLNRVLGLVRGEGLKPRNKVDLGKDAANPKHTKSPYSVALIIESLQSTHAATNQWSSSVPGRLIEYGPLANGVRTWASVDGSIKAIWHEKEHLSSCNGLTRENCLFQSLADIKSSLGVSDHYTVNDIVGSLKETYSKTGEWASELYGLIEYGPLANKRRTWGSVAKAINSLWSKKNPRDNSSGLTRENCPFRGLSALKNHYGMNDHYSVDDIVESLKATHTATGEWAFSETKLIEHGPLANGARKWNAVDGAMRSLWKAKNPHNSNCGLTRENCPFSGLAALKDYYRLNDDYTVDDIVESLRSTYDATGKWGADGLIEYGRLANGIRTWGSVRASMQAIWDEENPYDKSNGLTRENCPFPTLGDLKDHYGMNDHYSVTDIVESLKATNEATGKWAAQGSGLIQYGPLANGKRTWFSVDSSLYSIWREAEPSPICNGLTRENCPHTSLANLKKAFGFTSPVQPVFQPT